MARNTLGRLSSLLIFVVLVNVPQQTFAQTGPILFHVQEELPSGTLVGNVADASGVRDEVDPDLADSLQFQILSSDGLRITSMFSINSRSGAIFTNAMIDREQVCDLAPICELEFDVTVKSGVNFVKLLTVKVIIDDINDNAPSFPTSDISLTVPESSPLLSEIPISGALDHDAGLNTTIRYSLEGSSVFSLQEMRQLDGTSALKLIVQQALDRESVPAYSFLILAKDGDSSDARTGTLSVEVIVSDVNDNAPKFSEETFEMMVMETAPVGTVFGRLQASDGDIGPNGQLSFRFSLLTRAEVLELFQLNASSGEVVVASQLQYKSGRNYQCVVEVMDQGIPPQVSQASLQIHVQDAGNTPPKLDFTLADPVFGDRSAMLYEDVQLGTFVGSLKVEDTDEGSEGEVSCSSLEPHFALQDLSDQENKRYGIVVTKSLDRETQQELNVTITCHDDGSPSLTSVSSFSIIVRDVNDNAPEFPKLVYTATVVENQAEVPSVVRVAATDRDDSTNSELRYSLAGDLSSSFSVDPVSGWISSTSPLDRETTPVIRFKALAIDSGNPRLTGTTMVSLTVDDVNDNSPYVKRMDYYVSENAPVGLLFDLLIADDDTGVNGEVVVSVVNDSPPSDSFIVLSNGSIKVNAELDREKAAVSFATVVLKDRGTPPLSSTASLTIHVTDYNDHAPQFVFPSPGNRSVSVVAEIPVGTQLCQVSATDDDQGSNGNLLYTIADGNSGKWFGINNHSGEIFVIRKLLSVAGGTVSLRIAASDFGTPRLTTYSVLEINIGPSNMSLMSGADSNNQDQYIIIAGVIAGVTFVIAVVVIAIIIHMRNSDLRRRNAERNKTVTSDVCKLDNAKNMKVCNELVTTAEGKKTQGNVSMDGSVLNHSLSLDDGGFGHHDISGSRHHQQGTSVLTEEALEIHSNPSFTLFPEGRNRFVAEDHNSDTSGETTTCDSGRGASDEEIVYPLPGNGKGSEMPPRIPPREPLSTASKWSRDARIVSTNWTNVDNPRYVTDDNYVTDDASRYTTDEAFDTDTTQSSSPAVDLRARSRKGPLKVRFSFDGAADKSMAPDLVLARRDSRALGDDSPRGPSEDMFYSLDQGDRQFDNDPNLPLHDSYRPSQPPQYQTRHRPSIDSSDSQKHSYPRHFRSQNALSKAPADLPLHPDGLYSQHHSRYLDLANKHFGYPRQQRKSRNSDSLTSLPHSLDDDESTTTSGSYSIDIDDAMNVSLEC